MHFWNIHILIQTALWANKLCFFNLFTVKVFILQNYTKPWMNFGWFHTLHSKVNNIELLSLEIWQFPDRIDINGEVTFYPETIWNIFKNQTNKTTRDCGCDHYLLIQPTSDFGAFITLRSTLTGQALRWMGFRNSCQKHVTCWQRRNLKSPNWRFFSFMYLSSFFAY